LIILLLKKSGFCLHGTDVKLAELPPLPGGIVSARLTASGYHQAKQGEGE
jgi:hypothetical protein